MVNISQRLVEIRHKNGLQQKDVAVDIDIPLHEYREFEAGERNPDSDIIIKLCLLYNVDANWLLGLSDDPTPPVRS